MCVSTELVKRTTLRQSFLFSFSFQIKGVDDATYFFYIHDADKEKCMWLQRMQSASSKTTHNMVAHKSAVGVCYESTCDIKPGEELLVLYDDTYGGTIKSCTVH